MKKNIIIGILVILLGGSLYFILQENNFQSQSKNVSQHKPKQNSQAEEAFGSQVGKLPIFSSVCFPTYKQVCTDSECESTETHDLGTTFSLINNFDTNNPQMARCDAKGCDTYDAQYYVSGLYENYQPEQPRGFFIKKENKSIVDTETTSYVEVVTTGVTTILYSGYCKDVK